MAGRGPEPVAPVRVEIVPGQLSAQVYVHDLATDRGPLPCWSYVSDGMAGQQQAEIVFTLRRDPTEPAGQFPVDPLRLLATLFQLVAQGQRVIAGNTTEFGEDGLFGRHLLYADAQVLAGVELPPGCLAALLITADELRAVREFGAARILARLAQASSHYPFPPWSDRRRPGLALDRTFQSSLLSKIPRATAYDLHVSRKDNQIALSALRSEQPRWAERLGQVPEDVPLALLTALDVGASGCLVWVPGQTGPEAIGRPGSDGSRVCGCFLVFVADQPACRGKILEDGFAMELTREAWQAIRRALIAGQELAIPGEGRGMSFALTWRDEAPVSLLEGAHDAAGRGGNTPGGGPGPAPGDRKVRMTQARLLTALDQLAARTSIPEVAEFCREVERRAERVLGAHDGSVELLLRVRCTPGAFQADVARIGELPDATLQELMAALGDIARLPVSEGEVVFEIELAVSAGPGGTAAPTP